MNYYKEYQSKLRTADEAVKVVKSGDWVEYSTCEMGGFPIDYALSKRKDELRAVKTRSLLTPPTLFTVESDPDMEHFVHHSWHCSAYERKLAAEGRMFFSPMTFRDLDKYYDHLRVDVAYMTVAPMDEDGYFSFSLNVGWSRTRMKNAKIVVAVVNEALPRIYGSDCCKLHISEVDYVVEIGRHELTHPPFPELSDVDKAIASHIVDHIVNGATLQLGVGSIPKAIGNMIAESDVKNLYMHTELCTESYMAIDKAGKLSRDRKGVSGLFIGSNEYYDWLDNNDYIYGETLNIINDPEVIGAIDNFVSINGCIAVDLYGQVCSESVGTRQISGSGGQLDFVSGAAKSKGGKAFLCMSSAFTDKDGKLHSRIKPTFNGDIVTTPRSQAPYIVTEYGAVNINGMNTWERADALISIAHPDFRDELIRQAEKQHIWLPHNKR